VRGFREIHGTRAVRFDKAASGEERPRNYELQELRSTVGMPAPRRQPKWPYGTGTCRTPNVGGVRKTPVFWSGFEGCQILLTRILAGHNYRTQGGAGFIEIGSGLRPACGRQGSGFEWR